MAPLGWCRIQWSCYFTSYS